MLSDSMILILGVDMRSIIIHSTDKKRRESLALVLKTIPDFTIAAVSTSTATISLLTDHKFDFLIVDTNYCCEDILNLFQWCKVERPLLYRIIIRDEHLTTTYKSLISHSHGSLTLPSNGIELKRFVERMSNEYPDNTPVKKVVAPEIPVVPLKQRVSELIGDFHEKNPSQASLCEMISSDHEIARIVFKRINSPFYGLSNRIESIERAVLLMGMEGTITCLTDYIIELDEKGKKKVPSYKKHS